MFKYYIGDYNDIMKEINKIDNIKFSKDILYDLNLENNLFFDKQHYYFLYNKEFFADKKASKVLIERLVKSESLFIMIGDESIKGLEKYTTSFNTTTNEFMTLERLANLRENEAIPAYYKIYFKNPKYQRLFGEMINEVLTGHLTIAQSLKILLYKLS